MKRVDSKTLSTINQQAELALTSDGFTDIDFATLSSIIKRETLNCKETVVFAAAQAWGQLLFISKEGQMKLRVRSALFYIIKYVLRCLLKPKR